MPQLAGNESDVPQEQTEDVTPTRDTDAKSIDLEPCKPLFGEDDKGQRMKKWFITVLFGITNFGTGASSVILGMILLDLQLLTGTDTSDTAWIFTVKALGLLFGIVITGCGQSCLHIHILLMSWIFAGAFIALPFCRSLISLVGAFFIIGISYVSIYSVGTISMTALWKRKKSSSLYFITFCGYMGYIVSPAISYPFTTDYYRNWTADGFVIPSDQNSTAMHNMSSSRNATISEEIVQEVQWKLFIIVTTIASIVGLSGTCISIAACCLGEDTLRLPAVKGDEDSETDDNRHPFYTVCFFVFVGAVVQMVGDGQKFALAESYVTTYLSDQMERTRVHAVIVVTIFTVSQVVWAIFVKKIQDNLGPSVSFLTIAVFNFAGGAVLMVSGEQYGLFCVGSALIGVGLSAKSACLVYWVRTVIGDDEFVIYASYLCWAFGDLLFANLIGRLLDSNPFSFVYVIFGGSVAVFAAFLIGHLGYIVAFKKSRSIAATLRPLFVKEKVLYNQM